MSDTDKRDHLDAETPNESLLDVLRKRDRNLELNLRVMQPATVKSYDPVTQRASVVLGFLAVEASDPEAPDPPIAIEGVRVAWVKSATGFDAHPIAAGSTGIVLFADRALDEWYRKGGSVDPGDARAHSLSDPIFILGLGPDSGAIAPPPSPTARTIEAPQINLGQTAADFLYKGTTINTTVSALNATLLAVPPASDPITTQALANANTAAILGLFSALLSNLTTKAKAE